MKSGEEKSEEIVRGEGTSHNFCFDREMVTAIKGIAILIMVFHHLFGFPDWLQEGVGFFSIPLLGRSVEEILALQGKICVGIYTFLSGYGLYLSLEKRNRIFDWKYLLQKTVQLILGWWLICLLTQTPFDIAEGVEIKDILLRYILVYTSSNPNVWYLRFYLIALWTFPLWFQIIKRIKREWIWCIALPVIGGAGQWGLTRIGCSMSVLEQTVLYFPCLLMGALLYKAKYFEKIYALLSKSKVFGRKAVLILLGIFLMLLTIPIRCLGWDYARPLDGWLATLFVFGAAIVLQGKPKALFVPLRFLGDNSTNIWYEHATLIFRGAWLQAIVYAPYIPIVILFWAILLCLPVSLFVNWLMKKINVSRWFENRKKEREKTCV